MYESPPSLTMNTNIVIYLTVGESIIFVWAMGDSIYRWIKYKKRNEDPRGAIRKAHGYLFIHYFSIVIAFSFWALSIGELDPAHNPHILNKLAGFLLTASGWVIGFISRQTLSDRWSPDVYIIKNEHRITKWPFSKIKHPIYLGELLFFLGLGIFSENLLSLFIMVFSTTTYNYYRAIKEQ